jgi:glycosyltransferase involved in cell wall biosynthesis
MQKSVLVVASTFPRWKGDTEPDFVYWLEDSLSKDFDITVLAPHHLGAARSEMMGSLHVKRFRYFFPKCERLCYDGGIRPNMMKSRLAKLELPLLVMSEFFSAKILMLKRKFKLIHAHWILPQGFVAVILKKLFRARVIVTVHAGDIFPLKSGPFRILAKWTLRNSDFVTVNSVATGDAVRKVADVPLRIIPMGVDIGKFSSVKSSPVRKKYNIKGELVLSVGRRAEKKGVTYLITAMKEILHKFPKAGLMVVGDGPEKAALQSQASELGLADSVIFTGSIPKDKLPLYYKAADVFVLPSIVAKSGDTEGLGVVLLEAMASGIPVVASNVGGVPDIVIEGKTGLLFPEKDPSAIAKAVVRVLGSREIAKKLSSGGSAHAKGFSWENVSSKFRELYTAALGNDKF